MNIFNNFYDEVDYTEKSGDKDISGKDIYLSPVKIKARHVGGSHVYKINDNNTVVTYSDEYQLPPDIEPSEGDKINNHIILNVTPSRNVFGDLEFWIVKVE